MEHTPSPLSSDEILAHGEWVRRLAHALTATREDAEDVEQETWLAALRHPPERRDTIGGWLTAVARNAAHKLHRGSSRRSRREAASQAGSAPESPDSLVAGAELHGRVVAAVLALNEPYRQAVLLRFFEGLPVAAVSARMSAPRETTRARLRRAKEQLRSRLAEELGEGDHGWRAALAPLFDRSPGVPRVRPSLPQREVPS